MKEIYEFRIFKDKYPLLATDKGICKGPIYILQIAKTDPLFNKIGEIEQYLRKKNPIEFLFSFWSIHRSYTEKELSKATLFQFKIKTLFEPCGEECGTVYDEMAACPLCGANRKQLSILQLKKSTIPKGKDIAITLGNEVVVSQKFIETINKWQLKGILCLPTNIIACHQLKASKQLELSSKTLAGINPFDFSPNCKQEIYNCPRGDTIGLNLLSEIYVHCNALIRSVDLFESRQCIGVNRGLLRPRHLYLCSPKFRQMVLDEKLKGFEFEIAHIV